MVDFFRVVFLLAGILVSSLAYETKCLIYLDEVKEILSSKVPPINDSRMPDNYYNISRALYPSVHLPALYVKVTIQFLKDYQNGTKIIDDQEKNLKYTWSKACSYVSVKHIGLYAMSVFSLFTIYPQRRQSELVITVPPFCRNSAYATNSDTASETWIYIVATLEDIIINSKISDPRLNTVSCVVKGHEGDIAEYPNLWYFYWFILVSSFFSSLSLGIFFLQSINDNMEKKDNRQRVCGAALRTICPITVVMFIGVACSVPILSNTDWEMFLYYTVYIFLCLFSFTVGCIGNKCVNVGDKRIYLTGVCCLFPCLFQTFHHFLWVICGIISEPFWAIPIFLLECLFFVSIFFAFFLFEKGFCSNNTGDSPNSDETAIMGKEAYVLIHLITCWVSFAFILATIALIAINNGNAVAGPTAGAIESVMTVIFLWLVKNSRLDFWSRNKGNNERTYELN